jgi:hypothetical protein
LGCFTEIRAMTFGFRLAAVAAALASALAVTSAAEAGNRKAFKSLMGEAEAYCEEIRKNEVYQCSVEKCPCADGLREVKRYDKLRTRGACVCTPDSGRAGANAAAATDYCVDWNHRNGKETDRCFVVTGGACPAGASELEEFNRLRGRGPEQTACRGEPPKDEEEEAAEPAEQAGSVKKSRRRPVTVRAPEDSPEDDPGEGE